MRPLLVMTAALVLSLSGCGLTVTKTVVVTATPRPTPALREALSPQGFALTGNDVPSNLQQTAQRFHSNQETAADYGLDPQDLARRGRVTSYETEFKGSGATGLLSVDDVVAEWKSVSGAEWDYNRVVQSTRHSDTAQKDVQEIPADDIGDDRTAFSFRTTAQSSNVRDYVVVFRRGTFRIYLQAVAVAGTVADDDVLQLARTIDHRIPRAQ